MKTDEILTQLEKFIQIGTALSSEIDAVSVLDMIVQGAKDITHADGGTLYSIHGDVIKMEIIHSDTLGIRWRRSDPNSSALPNIPLYHDNGEQNLSNVVSYSFHKDQVINIADAYDDEVFDFSGTRRFDKLNNYRSKSFLSVPMKSYDGEIIGILQLINARDESKQNITVFDAFSERITCALASHAAIVLTKQCLIADLQKTLESLIELIATAIDEKSPYTGGHCRRVPELTMMIAEAAHQQKEGYLKDFLMSDADRYELKIAGWLHDCGKITTPEYVIDKATKLETIFDRIALVETRFEVLKRDAEIIVLKQKIKALESGRQPDPALELRLADTIKKLDGDWAFIKKANIGGEFMTPADQERVAQMQSVTWLLGGQSVPLLTDDEVKQLSIARGTLTAEERAIINNHISVTIAMLEKIPFPKHLRKVPEYAGGHHERMDGKGYPKGLHREEMSIQARIMAIADIFEALTAKDRPYKDGKKLSEALFILEKMKNENHIDPDIYDVFIKSKVYKQFAEKFLDDYQIDVD